MKTFRLVAGIAGLVFAASYLFETDAERVEAIMAKPTVALTVAKSTVTKTAAVADFNDEVKAMTADTQAIFFAMNIASAGVGLCQVISVKFGDYDEKGNGYWLVRCASGDDYVVQIARDRDAKAVVMGCDLLATIGINCDSLMPAPTPAEDFEAILNEVQKSDAERQNDRGAHQP